MPPSLPYVLPFGLFLVLLGVLPRLGLHPPVDQLIRLGLVGLVLITVSRPVLDFRVARAAASVGVGLLVFAIWIAPDLLFPGYRDLPLFTNALTGSAESGFPVEARSNQLAVGLRTVRAVVLVPIIEEVFWRAWLPRWIARHRFQEVPLGHYTRTAFAVTVVLFAVEHGAWWDVGLAAGVLYNWWMLRTRSLGDCILAHAVTNACLSIYVLGTGRWEYW